MAAGLGSLFICFALEYLDRTLQMPEELEAMTKTPCLGQVSSAKEEFSGDGIKDFYLITQIKPYSHVAEDFITLNVSVLFSFTGETSLKTILVTSSLPREGKTLIVSNMGINFAREKEETLLVDVDNVGADLSNVFKAPKEKGWSTLVKGKGTLEQAVVKTDIPYLSILPAGPFVPNIDELLEPEKVMPILTEMASRYKRILIDVPAVSVSNEAFIFGEKCDGTVLVVNKGVTSVDDVNHARTRLQGRKAKLLGSILNNAGTKR